MKPLAHPVRAWSCAVILVALTAGAAAGLAVARARPPAEGARPGDPWDFKSPAARAAKAKYDRAEREALVASERAIARATQTLVDELTAAMKEATRAANLDEAVKIRGTGHAPGGHRAGRGGHAGTVGPAEAGRDAVARRRGGLGVRGPEVLLQRLG